MMLGPGTRLGPYEILSALGAGGMGEVYRARDSRLNRDVAIKVMPAMSSSDPERLARFEQEARAAAVLSHPNILAVYDIGTHNGAPYIVSELLDGETLRERLRRGPVPTRKAVEYALQIAHGLVAAHAKAIVHRDLKPENIFITTDGHVKILDFGLAKLTEQDPTLSGSVLPTTPPRTMIGVVLGTIGYMAPEQVRGVAADHRADIFAFGAVLYEMLSGRRAFVGETPMDTMTAILKEEPADLRTVSDIPVGLERIVNRCLEKNPAARFQTASDLAFALDGLSTQSRTSVAKVGEEHRRWGLWSAIFVVSLAGIAAGAVIATRSMRSTDSGLPEMRLEVVTPDVTANSPLGLAISISPDGQTLVFPMVSGGKAMLWRRSLKDETAEPVRGTENGTDPFWSPDGRSLGFFADQKLKRVDLATNAVQTLADAPALLGGSWSRDGVIIAPLSNAAPLYRIAASGGQPVQLTRLQPMQAGHRFPAFLPDGRHFLFFGNGAPSARGIFLGSLDSPEVRRLAQSDSQAVFWPPDYLVFARQEALVAQHLDLQRLELTGEPVIVAPRVAQQPAGLFAAVAVSASAVGPLVYRVPDEQSRQLKWVDRSGKEMSALGQPEVRIANPRLSADGASVAAGRSVGWNDDIWVMDTARSTWRRLTSDDEPENRPVWSPDGTRLAFESYRKGVYDLYVKPIGGGTEEVLLESPENKNVYDWSPDGRFILYTVQNAKTASDLWALPLDTRKPFVLVQSEFNETDGRFSPDSRWIAYESNETGRGEVYVRPFPGPGRSWQISANGAAPATPQWRADGREIYYESLDNRLMAVPIAVQSQFPSVNVGTPSALFRMSPAPFNASPDGQRFLIDTPVGEPSVPSITVLLNWHGGR
jgi:serine/threonine protein kinase